MKDLVKKFLTEGERERITEAVINAEKKTSGEIVPMVVSASAEYPLSRVIGAFALSIPFSLAGAYSFGPLVEMGMRDLWVFLCIETALFILGFFVVGHVQWLRRLFIPLGEMQGEVRRSAVESFYLKGLYRTRDETGVLIYISIFERTVWVLADRGINAKVGQETWSEIVAIITGGIREGKQAEAICRAVERAGEILRAHFPIKPGDRDELPNIIEEG